MSTRINKHLAVVPGRAYADQRLKGAHKDALGVLTLAQDDTGDHGRGGWLSISMSALAGLTGLSRSRIVTVLKELVTFGYLERQQSRDATGASASNMYRVVYDADLPSDYDRWATDLNEDGIFIAQEGPKDDPNQAAFDIFGEYDPSKTAETGESNGQDHPSKMAETGESNGQHPPHKTPVGSPTHSTTPSTTGRTPPLKPAETGESNGQDHPSTADLTPPKKPQKQGSPTGRPPLARSIDNLSSTPLPSGEESIRVDSTRADFVDEGGSEVDDIANRILDRFLQARKSAFPEAPAGMGRSARSGQLSTIREFLIEPGASEDLVADTLVERIRYSADNNLGSPASVARYRNDVQAACRDAHRSAQETDQSAPVGLPDVPEVWGKARNLAVNAAGAGSTAYAIQTVEYIGRPRDDQSTLILVVSDQRRYDELVGAAASGQTGLDVLVDAVKGAFPDIETVDVRVDAGLYARRMRTNQIRGAAA